MDKDIIEEKLESLRLSLERIASKQPFAAKDLASNFDLQDIVSVNLQRAIQAVVDIAAHIVTEFEDKAPATMGGAFEILARHKIINQGLANLMQRAVAFRNILVHEYKTIDWKIVHQNLEKGLKDLKQFGQETSKYNSTSSKK